MNCSQTKVHHRAVIMQPGARITWMYAAGQILLALGIPVVDQDSNKKHQNDVIADVPSSKLHIEHHQMADAAITNNLPQPSKPLRHIKSEITRTQSAKKVTGSRKPIHLIAPVHGHIWFTGGDNIPVHKPVDTSRSVEGTYLWAVALFGTSANLAVVLTALCSKRLRHPLHLLISMLAAADLFVCLIYIPSYTYFLLENQSSTVMATQPRVPADTWGYCDVAHSIFIMVASLTLSLTALISLYLKLYTFSKHTALVIFSRRNTCGFICAACILNVSLIFTPQLLSLPSGNIYPGIHVCRETPGAMQTLAEIDLREVGYTHTVLILAVHIAQIVLTFVCCITVHCAILKGKSMCNEDKLAGQDAQLSYTRALRTTVFFFVSFLICWCPLYVVNLIDFNRTRLLPELHKVAMDLIITKSAMNPVIYLYGVRSLRFQVKMLCLCRCKGGPALMPDIKTSTDCSAAKTDGRTPSVKVEHM